MAERTPKLLASYEAAHTTERLPPPSDDHWLAAQSRIITLLDGNTKRVHVDMDDFSHNLVASKLFRISEKLSPNEGDPAEQNPQPATRSIIVSMGRDNSS